MADPTYLAIDLGAESGRLIGAALGKSGELTTREIHRWPNRPVRVADRLHWDVLSLFAEIEHGLRLASSSSGIRSIGVDTWGVDFALLDADGRLLGNPVHYRDERTERGMAELEEALSRAQLYESTGIQVLPINTASQLAAARHDASFERARFILGMPDLFTYWLTGRRIAERTFASTTQLYDTRSRDWSQLVLDALEIDRGMLQDLVDPGTIVGETLGTSALDSGLGAGANVTAVASHDTASAVVGTPARGDSWAFVSSGTWSLVGVEIPEPIVSDDALASNFTNEEGFGPTTRFLKNVTGLWLVQECRRDWERRGKKYSYDDLVSLALQARPLVGFVDPDDPSFMRPGDMPARIGAFLKRTDQRPAEDPGALVRCIFESLALKYRAVLNEAERLTARPVEVVHVVGGGARNSLLNQMVADATGRRVVAGPIEATVLGNALVQAHADGRLGSIEEMREVAARSSALSEFVSQEEKEWAGAGERFDELIEASTQGT